jgi:hypothetical protein
VRYLKKRPVPEDLKLRKLLAATIFQQGAVLQGSRCPEESPSIK